MGAIHFHSAKKSLGQNFLVDPNYKRKIANAVTESNPISIMEIGPGQGAITQLLEASHVPLYLAEKDTRFIDGLTNSHPLATIINNDFMKLDLSAVLKNAPTPMTVVGNLPYNVASQIFIQLLENHSLFGNLFLMFQKEMAERLIAKPGTRDYGLLTLWAYYFTQAKILFHLPPSVFRPRPKVDSSFVHFKIRTTPLLAPEIQADFWAFVRPLFQHRRKSLGHLLKKYGPVEPHLIKVRAETLSPEELLNLFWTLKS